jgi:folate-binding protein YgfZ
MGERLLLFLPRQGEEVTLETFQRTIPPRLAKISDLSSEIDVLRIVGPQAVTVATNAGLVAPERGGTSAVDDYMVARPTEDQPFVLQIACSPNNTDDHIAALAAAGAVTSDDAALEIQRIVAGWPRLGSEIDDKTLPQEVLYDELGGLSYSKGCYTGQETVARIHFRGHVNQRIAGLRWRDAPDSSEQRIFSDQRYVGRITSVAWLGTEKGYAGLAMLRREIDVGDSVTAGGTSAQVVNIPFGDI